MVDENILWSFRKKVFMILRMVSLFRSDLSGSCTSLLLVKVQTVPVFIPFIDDIHNLWQKVKYICIDLCVSGSHKLNNLAAYFFSPQHATTDCISIALNSENRTRLDLQNDFHSFTCISGNTDRFMAIKLHLIKAIIHSPLGSMVH